MPKKNKKNKKNKQKKQEKKPEDKAKQINPENQNLKIPPKESETPKVKNDEYKEELKDEDPIQEPVPHVRKGPLIDSDESGDDDSDMDLVMEEITVPAKIIIKEDCYQILGVFLLIVFANISINAKINITSIFSLKEANIIQFIITFYFLIIMICNVLKTMIEETCILTRGMKSFIKSMKNWNGYILKWGVLQIVTGVVTVLKDTKQYSNKNGFLSYLNNELVVWSMIYSFCSLLFLMIPNQVKICWMLQSASIILLVEIFLV